MESSDGDGLRHSRVRRLSAAAGLLACSAACGGCFGMALIPDSRTPSERAHDEAHHLELRCRGPVEDVTTLFDAIDSVEPLYSYVPAAGDHLMRLQGARVRLRPSATMSPQTIERAVECHQARVVLAEVPAVEGDPFVLPGAWLESGVESEGDGFVVLLRANDFEGARVTLRRARRFMASRQVAVP